MPTEIETVQWQVPPFEASPSTRYGWVEEVIREGEGFLEGQQCYKDLGRNLRVFDGIFKDKAKSTLVTNQLKYNIRKFCETLAEVREIASYGSDFPGYKKTADMLTKVSKCIYLESDFPMQILKVLQYATVMGIGYLWPKVRAEDYGYGERKLVFEPLGLLDVIPVQMPKSNDVQDCYAVTVYDYMPIAEAHARFPLFAGQFMTVGRRNYRSQLQAKRLDYAETFRYGDQGRTFGQLYTEIRYTFVRDTRINTTGYELPMGDQGTTWFYKVPSLGQPIFAGYRNGESYMRPAALKDCRVYPNLRLLITSIGMDKPIYDGPGFDWDPRIPIIQYTVDDWAWEPFGRSLVGDVASIEVTKRKLERKVDAVITVSLNPPMGYDLTQTGGPKIEHFDIFEEDVRLGVDGEPQKVLQSVLPDVVKADTIHFTMLKYLADAMKEQLGLVDLGNLQGIKMNIANDTADKMLSEIGPLAKGIAQRMEKANKSVGVRVKFLIPQWFDTSRIMEYVGPEGISREVFDYDPNNIVPSHMPDEQNPDGSFPTTESRYDALTRARYFAKQIRLVSVPSTLLKITQMQEQLKYLQLKRGQAPISWLTVFKKMDVENPEQEIERSFQEEAKLAKLKILTQVDIMQMLKQMGIDPSILGGGEGGGGNPKGGGSGKPGRPSSGQKGPRIRQKGGGGGEPRTTVTES